MEESDNINGSDNSDNSSISDNDKGKNMTVITKTIWK